MLGIIPARGGSKRIPRKNVRELGGKRLVEWTIEAMQGAGMDGVVSTEDGEIALVSINHRPPCKALVRPKELATDEARTEGVILHVLGIYPQQEAFCLLQPTSPFRTSKHILEALSLFERYGNLISVNEDGERNGAIYIQDAWEFQKQGFDPNSYKYVMKDGNLDIDTEEDWRLAEEHVRTA